VGFAVDLIAFGEPFAEDESICQSGPAGGDVDGTASSKVEGGEIE
jgi:hypothetical protein